MSILSLSAQMTELAASFDDATRYRREAVARHQRQQIVLSTFRLFMFHESAVRASIAADLDKAKTPPAEGTAHDAHE